MSSLNIGDSQTLNVAVEVLVQGGMVMHPTETCYGFAVDIFNEDALKNLYVLKGRAFNKPLSVLVNSLEVAMKYGFFSKKAMKLAEKFWPGQLSIVVPRRDSLPKFLNKGEGFVSFRVSNHIFTRGLVEVFGGPLTTTSANVSGNEPLYEVDLKQFGERKGLIDLVVDGGKIPNVKPSTVVKVDGDAVEVLRQGEIIL